MLHFQVKVSNYFPQGTWKLILPCYAYSFSPDGSTMVSSDDSGAICVWGHNKSITR